LFKKFREKLLSLITIGVVIELSIQKLFQFSNPTRSQQTGFQAAPSLNLPSQGYHICYEYLLDHIERFYRRADLARKRVISSGVLSIE